MKKFYYFSKSKLKFVEIRNFYKKFVFLVAFFAVLASFFVFGSFLVFNEFINPDSEVKSLKNSNKLLKEKFEQLVERYQQLDETVTRLNEQSKDLRLKANLEPKQNEINFGIGGSVFEPIESFSAGKISSFLKDVNSYVDQVSLKVKLEKNNYSEITYTLKQNESLFDVIPAIRPGEGVVESVGWKGGYGLTVEISHGFGYKTLFAHLENTKVKQGQKISRGELIAYSGNSGRLSSGPHLHYEVQHNGVTLDPINFIYDDVKIFEVAKK